MRPNRILLLVLALLFIGLGYYFFSGSSTPSEQQLLKTIVAKGPFVIEVTANGELQAKRSEKIRGPQGMRAARIYQTTITDMVPEGTVVSAGEYVATLDKTELDSKMKEELTEIDRIESQLEAARIDTAIEMRGLRDQIVNLKFGLKEKKLEVEQSKYEAPMVIQQAQIEMERSKRDLKQLLTKYDLTKEKAEANISQIMASLRQSQLRLNTIQELAQKFVIKAPKDGMVIYSRNWNGKVSTGSQISTWNPVVAELPDLTDMVSKSYVNEVDISRVRKGQEVTISVDAFPDNQYRGQVITVANIGEQLRNYDSKVFEVIVQVYEADSILRPAMTTSNKIVTDTYESVLHIPLEALHNDSLTYVFKEVNGQLSRVEVVAGATNDNESIIQYGLEEGDEVLLSLPEKAEQLPWVFLEESVKQAQTAALEADRKARAAKQAEQKKQVKEENISRESSGGDNVIIIN